MDKFDWILEIKSVSVDLHNMEIWEAKRCIDFIIENLEKDVKEVVVIHGYHSGDKLATWLRKSYKNKKIKQKLVCSNNGITRLCVA